jgi:prophage regulatory protein
MQIIGFMSEKEVLKITSLSRSTIWRLRKANQFPKKYRLSNGCHRYKESELIAWCQDRLAA